MWASAKTKDYYLHAERTADLMKEPDSFYIACKTVIKEWPNSSMQNLSSRSSNRCAWIGQAASWLNHGSVEYTTRMGWRLLSDNEKDSANRIASKVIEEWEQCQRLD